MQDDAGHRIPQADQHRLLGGNPMSSAFRESFAPQAGPKKLLPLAIGLITTVSVVVVLLFVVF